MACVEAPRAVSSTARPTRPPCEVLRPSRPAACADGGEPAVALVDAEADNQITRVRRGRGVEAADRGRAAADQTPHVRSTPVGSDFERRTVTTTSPPASDRSTPAQRAWFWSAPEPGCEVRRGRERRTDDPRGSISGLGPARGHGVESRFDEQLRPGIVFGASQAQANHVAPRFRPIRQTDQVADAPYRDAETPAVLALCLHSGMGRQKNIT